MDSKDFTNQLVQFAGVEQQISQSEKLEKILAVNEAGTINGAVGFIGKNISYEGANFVFDGTTPPDMSYYLGAVSSTTKISILDQDKKVIWSNDGEKTAGEHELEWNGKTNDDLPVEAGTYTLQVAAVDSDKKPITTGTMVSGKIDGVEVVDGTVMLRINKMIIGIDTVLSVKS